MNIPIRTNEKKRDIKKSQSTALIHFLNKNTEKVASERYVEVCNHLISKA